MTLLPENVDEVLAAARENVGQISAALSQALGEEVEVLPEQMEPFAYTVPPPEWNGPGLLLAMVAGESAVVAVLASSSGLIPESLKVPSEETAAKLAQLTQQISAALFPAPENPFQFVAQYVANLALCVQHGGITSAGNAIHCRLRCGDRNTALRIVWPIPNASAIFEGQDEDQSESFAEQSPGLRGNEGPSPVLPSYVRSLLKISVPLSVEVAATRQSVTRILNLGPGSIIQFEKHCEHLLTLCVGGQAVALGEAVKVGDKFGIKIDSMILPGERIVPLRKQNSAG